MTTRYRISVSIGYDLRTVEVSAGDWKAIERGEAKIFEVEDYYEGELFTYLFEFNISAKHSLVVTYGDADGYLGDISDALIEPVAANITTD